MKLSQRFTRLLQVAALCLVSGFLIIGCGGGGGGVTPTLPVPTGAGNNGNDYSAPREGLKVSERPVQAGDELVYRLTLPEPGRTAALQVELEYDSEAIAVKGARVSGPMDKGMVAFNDHGGGRLTLAAINSRVLVAGGTLVEIVVEAKGGNIPDNAVRITGYELTNVEGKTLGRSSLSRVVKREGDITAACWLKCGDVSGDAGQSAADATLALRAAVGLDDPDYHQTCAGDVAPLDDPDGSFSAADATLMLRKTVGLSVFGCGTEGTFVARPLDEAETTMNAATYQRTVADEIVVLFNDSVTAETIDEVASANGIEAVGRNSVTGAYQFRVGSANQSSVKSSLSSNANVASAENNPVLYPLLTPNDPNFSGGSNSNRWGYEKIQAPSAWSLTTGSGDVIIAIVDTGVDYDHTEFAGRIVQGYDFHNGDNDPYDDAGHGTHVAGIAAGAGNNGAGMAGGCWNCKIMPVKVLGVDGGSSYAVINGITWAANHGAKVINLSLGGLGTPSLSEINAINKARELGAVVVVAAGNNAINASNFSPAAVPNAVTVGSTDSSDGRSWFSNYGSVVDIAAPGSSIYSTLPGNSYELKSGTSMAAPMVSGVAGLIWSINPTLTVSQVESYLTSNIDTISPDQPIGAGRLSAYKAVNAAKPSAGNISPSVSLSATPTSGNAPLTVNFTATCADTDGTCQSFAWNFGDLSQTGTTSNTAKYTYAEPGTYTATVITIDNQGGKGTATVTITVAQPAGNQAPTVSLSANKTSGEIPLTVNFTATCTDSDGTCKYFSWNFGDFGQQSTSKETASYTFKKAGTYTVKVRAIDDDGASAEATKTITVTAPSGNNAPTVSISADKTSGAAPLTVTFTGAASDSDGSIKAVWWNFGDYSANAVVQNPVYTYERAGTYTATIMALDDDGASTTKTVTITVTADSSLTVTASVSPTSGTTSTVFTVTCAVSGGTPTKLEGRCDPTGLWYEIYSGNYMECEYVSPGDYTPGCRVNGSGTDGVNTPVIVSAPNQAPTASASANPTSGTAPLTVQFTGGCTDSDGTCASYSWNFGDGSPASSSQSPSHTFSSLGTFTVTLTVKDDRDATGQGYTTVTVNSAVPSQASKIAARGYHTCALTTSGGVKCWGWNANGQLGDGTQTDRYTPVDVSGLTSGVTAIAAGWYHTCAVTTGGGVKCWGNNEDGQLGDGTMTYRFTPVDVSGLPNGVAAIAAGKSHTCALTTSGGVKCWGQNNFGQLGDGTATKRWTPVDVSGLTSGVAAIAAGQYHTCAVTTGGGVKCWGNNGYGQLGDGTTTYRLTPVDVSGLTSGVTVVAAGSGDYTGGYTGGHTCAVTTGGSVKCWGSNGSKQLGDGTMTNRYTPVNVTGLTTGVTAVAAGEGAYGHTCALTTSGGVKCWGNNYYGQLGVGTHTDSYTPVDVSGLTSGVTAIAAGWYHTCTVTTGGGVKCWGKNDYGKLGNGTTTDSTAPVSVVGF